MSTPHAHFAAPVGQEWKSDTFGDAVRRARDAVQAGVTRAFDKGWSNLDTIRVIDEIEPEFRPDIEAAGIINAVPEGYWPDFARELTPETFEAGIKESVGEGKGWVKLIGDWPRRGIGPVANFDEAQLSRTVELAADSNARVAIHTMAREVPSVAVRAGVHSIEHGLFLTEDDLDLLGARAGMWVPTILRMEAVVTQLGAESSGGRLLREGLDNVRALMPLAAEAGCCFLPEPMLRSGFMSWREKRSGCTNADWTRQRCWPQSLLRAMKLPATPTRSRLANPQMPSSSQRTRCQISGAWHTPN